MHAAVEDNRLIELQMTKNMNNYMYLLMYVHCINEQSLTTVIITGKAIIDYLMKQKLLMCLLETEMKRYEHDQSNAATTRHSTCL